MKQGTAAKSHKYRRKIRRDPLDDLFSEYIRKRAMVRVGGCEKCKTMKFDTTREDGSTKPAYMQLEAAHYHGRGPHATRWDIDNSAGLCMGCHSYLDANPVEKTAWFKEQLGDEAFELLELLSLIHI